MAFLLIHITSCLLVLCCRYFVLFNIICFPFSTETVANQTINESKKNVSNFRTGTDGRSVPVFETRGARACAPPQYVCLLPPGEWDGGTNIEKKNCIKNLYTFPALSFLINFRKRATNYRALLRTMTYKDNASYWFSPPCRRSDMNDFCFRRDSLSCVTW